MTSDGHIPLDKFAHEGANTVEILFENLGCPNFGPVIELEQGIERVSLVSQAARVPALDQWRMKLVPANVPAGELTEIGLDSDEQQWPSVRLDEPTATTPAGKSAVYRTSLPVTQECLHEGVVLTFPTIDDNGMLFVNGREAGRADDWSHAWTCDITK